MLLILWFVQSFLGTLLLGLGLIYFVTPERPVFIQYLYTLFCTPTSIFDPIPYIAWLFGVLMTATFVLWSPDPTPGDDTAWKEVLYSPLFVLAFQDWFVLIPVAILLLLTLVTVSQNYIGLFIEPFLVIPTSTMPLPRILELTMAGMRSSYVVECGARCITAATESSLEARDECLGLGGVGVVCAGLQAHEGERGAVKALALSIISLTYGSFEGCSQVQREGGVASLLTLIQHHWGNKEVVRTCLWALASASGVRDSGIKGEGPLRLLIQCLHHGLDTREARTARMGAWALSNALRGSASNRRLFCMGLGGVRVLLQALKRGVGEEVWEEGWGEILEAINRALAMALGGFTETEMEGMEVEVEGKVEDEGGGVGEVAHQQLVDEGGIEAILQGLLEHCGGGKTLPFIVPPPPQTLPPATDDDAVDTEDVLDTEEWVLNNGEGVDRNVPGGAGAGVGAGAGAAPLPPTTTTTIHMRPGAVEWYVNTLGALCYPLPPFAHHRAAGGTRARAHTIISLGGIGVLLQALEALVHFPPTMPVIPAQATILALLRVITAAAGGASTEGGVEGEGGGGGGGRNVAQDIALAAGAIPLLVTFYAATECPITRRCLMTLGYLPDGNPAPSQPTLLLLRLEKDARDARLKSCLECWRGGVACPGKAGGHSVERQCAICMGGGGGAMSVGASNSSSSSSSKGNSNGAGNGNGNGDGSSSSSSSPPPSVVHPNTHQNSAGDKGSSSSRGSREWEVLPCGHAFHFACIMSWAAHESRVGEGEGGGGGGDGGAGAGAGARLSGVVHCPVDRCVVSRVGSGDPRVIGAGELPVATPRWGVGGSSSSLLSSNSGVGGFK